MFRMDAFAAGYLHAALFLNSSSNLETPHVNAWLVASPSVLGCPQLVHLLHALLELLVLAFLIRVSLVLRSVSFPWPSPSQTVEQPYLALPWQVELLVPTPVQRDEKMCARVSVGQGQSGGAHLLAGGLCCAVSTCAGREELHKAWWDGLLGSPVMPTACLIDSVTVMAGVRGVVRLQWRAGGRRRRGGLLVRSRKVK
jgi:hypothetical protein